MHILKAFRDLAHCKAVRFKVPQTLQDEAQSAQTEMDQGTKPETETANGSWRNPEVIVVDHFNQESLARIGLIG